MTRASAETDPRFHGGSWVGYTLRPSAGGTRHATVEALSFAGGLIKGIGSDESGVLTVHGRYDVRDGKCIWIQTYPGRREVMYSGFCDGPWVIKSNGFRPLAASCPLRSLRP